MQQQDFYFDLQTVAVFCCLARGGIERDGEISGEGFGRSFDLQCGEGEDVSRFVFASIFAIQIFQCRVVSQQDIYLPI